MIAEEANDEYYTRSLTQLVGGELYAMAQAARRYLSDEQIREVIKAAAGELSREIEQ